MVKRPEPGYNKLFTLLAARPSEWEAILPAAAVNTFLDTLGLLIYYGTVIYVFIVILRVLLTWINPNPYSPAMRFLSRLADPLLNRARRWFPLTLGGLDFSPLLATLVVYLAGTVLGIWLRCLAQGLPVLMIAPLVALGLIRMLDSIAWILLVVMAIRFIMSLVHPSPYNIIVQVIYGITEPLLAPLRRWFPPGPRGMDYRPLFFLLVAILIKAVVLGSLSLATARWMSAMSGGG